MQTVTNEAVLVFLLGNSESQVLVVQGGIPLYNQSLSLAKPGVIDEALVPHAIDFARTMVRKDHNIENFHITTLGQARAGIDLQNLGIEEWEPDFSQVFNLESPEDVLLYPQLFGAGYVDKSYDFLPKEYANSWRLQSFSLKHLHRCRCCRSCLAWWLAVPAAIVKRTARPLSGIINFNNQATARLQQPHAGTCHPGHVSTA